MGARGAGGWGFFAVEVYSYQTVRVPGSHLSHRLFGKQNKDIYVVSETSSPQALPCGM